MTIMIKCEIVGPLLLPGTPEDSQLGEVQGEQLESRQED